MRIRNYGSPVPLLLGQKVGGPGTENTLPKGVGTPDLREHSARPYEGPYKWLYASCTPQTIERILDDGEYVNGY